MAKLKKGDIVNLCVDPYAIGLIVEERYVEHGIRNFRVLYEGELSDWQHPHFSDWKPYEDQDSD